MEKEDLIGSSYLLALVPRKKEKASGQFLFLLCTAVYKSGKLYTREVERFYDD